MRSIDLFAGIGGIRLGFEQAFDDLETVFISEIDKFARQTYYANFGNNPEIQGDITKIAANDIPDHDILLAGFPCQAFSVGGRQRGFEDRTRGTLFFDILRIVKEKQPKIIFLENVKNLTKHKNGSTFYIIFNALEEVGYYVTYQILNSKDFGVPQSRERVYIVCVRKDIFSEPFIADMYFQSKTSTIADIKEQNADCKYYLSQKYYEGLEQHKARHAAKGHGFGYIVREDDDIFGTLTCSGSGKESNILRDVRDVDWSTYKKGKPNEKMLRMPTPREFARAQGFPDSFIIPVSDTQAYKQFGNTVTVPVVKAIAEQIKKYIG